MKIFECKTINEINCGPVTNFPLHVWWSDPQVNTTVHQHSFTELVLILRGKAEHDCDGLERSLVQGDIIVIPPGAVHCYKKCSPDFALVNIIFLPDQLPVPLIDVFLLPGFDMIFHCRKTDNGSYPFVHLQEKDFIHLRGLAEQLKDENIARTPGYRFSMLGIFMMILTSLSRIFSHEHVRNPQIFLHINGVISYLNCHFKEECPLATLCHIAGMSRATLQRNFLNATGTSPRQYQIQLRIAEAATLLRSTNKTFDDIAAELGFGNRNYFSRQFHKIIGISPGQFRKKEDFFYDK